MPDAFSLIKERRKLAPTGADGFEGLIAHLLSRLTGYRFLLSASGRQEGRDMRAPTDVVRSDIVNGVKRRSCHLINDLSH